MDTMSTENSTIVRSNKNATVPTGARQASTRSAPQASPDPSGTSRRKVGWRLSLLRWHMRALSKVSPSLAAAWMQRIWFSAPRTQSRPEAQGWLRRSERIEFTVHGHRVVSWTQGSGATVLLVHGWGGNAGQMHALADALLAQGLRVVAFDAPAHGASDASRHGGQTVSMREIADALRVVAAGVGPIMGLVAHSGGCTATALALRDGWKGPERIAFIAPFALASEAIVPFAAAIGASPDVAERFRARVERDFGRPWTDFDIPPLPSRRTLPSLLVIHDHDDREVPFFHGERTAAAWPDARLIETRGLGHRRILRDPRMITHVTDFMRQAGPVSPVSANATPADARHELDQAFATSGLAAPRPAAC